MEQKLWNKDVRESEKKERVILAGVCTGDEAESIESMDELEALARTAGGSVAGRILQLRSDPHPVTYLGTGKVEELMLLAEEEKADAVICDDELSPVQMRNLQSMLECPVLDRTLLILDIFAEHASTSEGKIQVELAQLTYRATHLSGMGKILSRQGGGIGTRGPGEKKLEIDRRRIRERISHLKKELEEVRRHRSLVRKSRAEGVMAEVAIVGYTNAGKSTLLNCLTQAGVYAQDQLFATLDPVTRGYVLPGGTQVLLTDTVGFIRKLPHTLIEAFRSTLEEAKYADLILHVVDASSPEMEKQMYVVYETLRELGAAGKKIITLFNKQDRCVGRTRLRDVNAERSICGSAATGEGMEELALQMEELLTEHLIRIERLYPYHLAGKAALIRKYGKILSLEYRSEGIALTALVPPEIYGNV